MSNVNSTVIIVTARRVDGPSPGWSFAATVTTYGPRNQDGSGGALLETRTLGGEDELRSEIRELDQNDRIIIKVPGMPTMVIDGRPANDFFQSSFNLMATLMTAMADGRIAAALPGLDRSVRAFIQDLKEDFESAAAANRFVRVTNVASLQTALQDLQINATLDPDETALAITIPLSDAQDYDRDPSTTSMHQLFFNSSKTDRLGDPPPGSRVPTSNGLTIQLLHEMFHFVEGDASVTAEMQRMAQLTGKSQAASVENHDPAYDAAAAKLNNLLREMRTNLNFDPAIVQSSTVRGTDGADQIHLANPVDGATFITSEAGNDLITTSLGNFTLATGDGDDVFVALQGSGWLAWIDESGSDRLDLTTVGDIGSLAVELVEGWVYIGGQPKGANQAAGDLDSGLYFRPENGPDFVTLGATTFALADILGLANSRPHLPLSYNAVLEAPFQGGYVGQYVAVDYDDDPLTLSVISVEGVGAGAAWWFDGFNLYTSVRYLQQATQLSYVTIRVSDGGLFRDYVATVEWRPDPFGGPEYMPIEGDLVLYASNLWGSEPLPTLEGLSMWGV